MSNVKIERRSIPGFEGYYSITADGIVYSDDRVVERSDGRVRRVRERTLKIFLTEEGGGIVSLAFEGKQKSYAVNTLLKATYPELFTGVVDLPGESWKPIDGFPMYRVSNMGRIKIISRDRKSGGLEYVEPEDLVTLIGNGTENVNVKLYIFDMKGQARDQYNRSVSRLVYKYFIGRLEDAQLVRSRSNGEDRLHASNLYI